MAVGNGRQDRWPQQQESPKVPSTVGCRPLRSHPIDSKPRTKPMPAGCLLFEYLVSVGDAAVDLY
jgi:hypothetical protein